MRVIIALPGKPAETREIDNTLESLQKLVGGYIEVLSPVWFEDMALICNEEGKLLGLPPNRIIKSDIIAGPLIIAGINLKTGEFEDIPEFVEKLIKNTLDKRLVQEAQEWENAKS